MAYVGIILFNLGLNHGLAVLGGDAGRALPRAFMAVPDVEGTPYYSRTVGEDPETGRDPPMALMRWLSCDGSRDVARLDCSRLDRVGQRGCRDCDRAGLRLGARGWGNAGRA